MIDAIFLAAEVIKRRFKLRIAPAHEFRARQMHFESGITPRPSMICPFGVRG
jgi:hypothetical protein